MSVRFRLWEIVVALLNGRDDARVASLIEHSVGARSSRWAELVSLANAELITAPVWSALRRCGLERMVPADTADYLRSFHAFNVARNRAILAQLSEFVSTLNSAGIEPMLLKGSAYLVAGLFPDVGDRYLSDIDVLVPEGEVGRAETALEGLGYRPASEIDYTAHHHLVPMIHPERPAAIELHRAPVPRYAQRAIPGAELWAHAELATAGNVRSRLASPTDTAMLSFMHSYVVDRDGALLLMPLRLFHDMHLLQQRHSRTIDWRRNYERASSLDSAGTLRRYLHVLHRLSGLELSRDLPRSATDNAFFAVCAATVAWPALAKWARTVDGYVRNRTHRRR